MTRKELVLRRIVAGTVLTFGIALSGSTLAQAPGCKADLARFCPEAKPGSGAIAACLKKNAAQLSAPCKQRVGEMKQILKEVHKACEEDIHFLCDGIQQGGGRIAACLKQSASEVSAGCKARIAEAKKQK